MDFFPLKQFDFWKKKWLCIFVGPIPCSEALDHPATLYRQAVKRTGLLTDGVCQHSIILLLFVEILPHTSKDSAAVKYIAGHYRREDLFLLVPYKSLLKYFAPKLKTPLSQSNSLRHSSKRSAWNLISISLSAFVRVVSLVYPCKANLWRLLCH
jgi:hypothetical protein